jgi:hypothetical protein
LYGASTHYLQLTLTNTSPTTTVKTTNMEVVAKEDAQQVYPFPEVEAIEPNASVVVDVHVDFAGDTTAMTLSIESESGASSCTLSLPVGECVRPREMTWDDYKSQCDAMPEENKATMDLVGKPALGAALPFNLALVDTSSEENGGGMMCFAGEEMVGGGGAVLVTFAPQTVVVYATNVEFGQKMMGFIRDGTE